METNKKMPLLVAVLLFLTGTTVVLGAVAVVQDGAVRVSVQEKKPGGEHIRLFVPAVIVPPVVRLIPEEEIARHAKELRPWLPAIRIASKSLAEAPDAVLVEVKDEHDHLVITKKGRTLLVDVTSPDADVHVAVPLGMVNSIAERLEESAPPV